MRKIFGTDGVRGKANQHPMTAEMALKLGQAAAVVFRQAANKTHIAAIIGKDTRRSGYMFENALAAGLCSMGVDVYFVGPLPTPAIAHLTKSFACDLGIVISASHNPAEDNGIKFFDRDGFKLSDEVEEEIERVMNAGVNTGPIDGLSVGKARRIDDASGRYIEFIKNSIKNMSLRGLKVVLDCANGAAYKVAPSIISELGAEVIVLNNGPDGSNINRNCGSQHPGVISDAVLKNKADIGISLDGDADRVIMVDELGKVIDGDRIIALCALDMKRRGKLDKDTVVVTVMANLGFEEAMKANGIRTIRAKVGDRYVLEEMRRHGYKLGGEQSGHVIFANRATTGDGTLTALQVLALMKITGKPLSELADCMKHYPQVLKNVVVREKKPIGHMPHVSEVITDVEERLGDRGRVLIRYSGTEDKCRVMIEGKDLDEINRLADEIVAAIIKEIGA
ncbi:phosphoglucosamine mutase [Candidatus Woesearchaeota archaeon]|nr:phosphoglucosamine mutase [Candidatus Woesearchaeota archaeon]